jgi:hypothetical protein
MKMITLKSLSLSSVECKPGSPVINRIDEENNIAYMTVAIDGEDTQRAFNKACDLFNEVSQYFILYLIIFGYII